MKTGRKHGVASNLPFDGWFRYPAGFSAETLDSAYSAINDADPGPVLDPFAGVATVGTRAAAEGREFIGIEAHPLVAMIARLKLNHPENPDALVEAAERVVSESTPIEPSDEAELVLRCFSTPILAELIGLRTMIEREVPPWKDYLEAALLSLLRDHAQVKVGWPYQRPGKKRQPRLSNPSKRLVELCRQMASDMNNANASRAWVVNGDARQASAWKTVRRRQPTAMISSPPYLNNFDYADATRLELYFSKRASSWAEMCETVRNGMVVATTQQTKREMAKRALRELEETRSFHEQLIPLVASLTEERGRRSSGKHYDWMASLYFRDLWRVMRHLKQTMPAGAPLVWIVGDSAPYGIYFDTPALLGHLGETLGFVVVDEKRIRSRGKRWRTNGRRHQVDLCEKQVVWRAPGQD